MGTLDPRALVHAALTLLFAGPIAFAQEVSVVEFQRDIRPILSDRCFACHGPDPAGRNSDLRLDSADAAFKDLGGYKAIVPGNLEDSELIYRITASNLADRMPPSDSGLSLEEREIELLKSWVRQGADFSPHWAYGKPPDSSPPAAENSAWPRDPIDSFILNKLREVERSPAEEAEPLAWLRRVHFAITGLPPTEEGARKFMESHSEEEYEKVVDSLLSSPHFGERMAQSWLDLARYADTFGYQSDVGTRVWPYRDWVIQAFNQNLPYDEFVRWQLAGDLLPNATAEQKTATAFNRLHRQTNEGGSVEEEYRIEYVSDRVHTFGTTFMGLTLECARCHDHRYDPISQKEYYQLSAYFDDIDESGLYSHFTSATPTPALDLPSPEQAQALAAAVAKVENEKIAAANGQLLDTTHKNASHRFTFDDRQDVQTVESPRGRAASLDGDTGIRMTGAGAWNRSDPFSVSMLLKTDRHHDRAVLLHRSRAWTDAGSQGWQILIEDGRLLFALIHFWPGLKSFSISATCIACIDNACANKLVCINTPLPVILA
ncbi:MAG TPA: hypothetical protein DDW23_07355 [Planctomycetes bacterium]|nr:hypothetical protein [Planctomycetota bacterium]